MIYVYNIRGRDYSMCESGLFPQELPSKSSRQSPGAGLIEQSDHTVFLTRVPRV